MKAIIQDRYGSPDVLEIRDVEKPVVANDDVLLRVRAASVNPYDWHFMRGQPHVARLIAHTMGFGLRGPRNKVRGWDVAGQVEAVGANVHDLAPGDEVFGWCRRDGAFAEYVCVGGSDVVRKPQGLTFEQAAAIPAVGITALSGLRDQGRISAGRNVLVNGASGGVGTTAVQIARSFGAEVTGVCSARNVDMVRSIGADHVFDYTREDFTRGPRRYDLMLDNVGNRSLSECLRVLRPRATYIANFGRPENPWFGPFPFLIGMRARAPFVSQKMAVLTPTLKRETLLAVRDLVEAGKLAPVIDRTYPLDRAPEAIRYVETGHARGKVVITM